MRKNCILIVFNSKQIYYINQIYNKHFHSYNCKKVQFYNFNVKDSVSANQREHQSIQSWVSGGGLMSENTTVIVYVFLLLCWIIQMVTFIYLIDTNSNVSGLKLKPKLNEQLEKSVYQSHL